MRIVIGEDSALFREGLARLLDDAGHDVVTTAADAPTLLAAAVAAEPDLVIADVRMPPNMTDDGARAAVRLRELRPGLPVMLLSQHVETRHSVALAGSNGFGYLLKDRVLDVDDFLDAVRRVAAGGTALDPEVVAQLVRPSRRDDPLAALTDREQQVLALMAEGRSNAAIARCLVLTGRTVESHVRSMFTKLGLLDGHDDHRRVLAVLAHLRAHTQPTAGDCA